MAEPVDRLAFALADRYTIEREVGRGGMATVYLAEDVRHHRKVAVKVLAKAVSEASGSHTLTTSERLWSDADPDLRAWMETRFGPSASGR